jgi:hypothetical protein
MARHWQAGLAIVVLAMLAGGCGPSKTLDQCPDLLPRDIAERGAGESSGQARSQMPEGGSPYHSQPQPLPPAQLLGTAPDRPPEVSGVAAAARICATVNGVAILNEEVEVATRDARARLGQIPEPEYSKKLEELFKAALDHLIDREVVLDHAYATLHEKNAKALAKLQEVASKEFEKQWLKPVQAAIGVKSEEEFKQFLRSQHMSLNTMRRQWERDFMKVEYLHNMVYINVDSIGHVDMERYYNEHPEEFQVTDSVEWEDLLVGAGTDRHPTREAARQFADVLANRIRQGESVDKLKNFNDGESALNHGKGTGNKRGDIKPPECETILFQMKEGDVTVLETERAYHVIKLIRRQYAGLLPFDEKTQQQIKNKLRNEAGEKEMKRMINQWRREAIVIVAKE